MRIFYGSSHPKLGHAIAEYLNAKAGEMKTSKFSCGETYARVTETIRGHDCYIIQAIGQQPNDDYMELFLILIF